MELLQKLVILFSTILPFTIYNLAFMLLWPQIGTRKYLKIKRDKFFLHNFSMNDMIYHIIRQGLKTDEVVSAVESHSSSLAATASSPMPATARVPRHPQATQLPHARPNRVQAKVEVNQNEVQLQQTDVQVQEVAVAVAGANQIPQPSPGKVHAEVKVLHHVPRHPRVSKLPHASPDKVQTDGEVDQKEVWLGGYTITKRIWLLWPQIVTRKYLKIKIDKFSLRIFSMNYKLSKLGKKSY